MRRGLFLVSIIGMVSFFVFAVLLASGFFGGGPRPQLPQGVELQLGKFPILPGDVRMDNVVLGKLGLRAEKLEKPLGVFVHYRYGTDQRTDRESHWHYRVLKSSTAVAVDRNGRPWYLISDARRIYGSESGSSVVAASGAKAKTPPVPPKKSPPDKGNGGFPWPWLWAAVLAAAALTYLIWRHRKRDEAELNRAIGPDPDDDLPGQRRPAVATDPGSRPEGFFEAISRIAGIEREVADVRETLGGLEDRVVTRLEPVVKQAAEGGGKARAQALLAERIVELSADPKSAKTIAALTRVLESVS